MKSLLNPYLTFNGNARQAMEFYHSVFGGKLTLNTYADFHASDDPSEADKIMHGQLEAENGIVLMGADIPKGQEYNPGNTISISLSGDNEAELRSYYDKLVVGGQVIEPMEKAPWGDTFGMLKDRQGIEWMVNVRGSQA